MAIAINNDTSKEQLWVAIDMAKYQHEVLMEYPNGTQKRLVMMNTLSDFHRLDEKLKDAQMPVHIGFEATGYYHRGLAYFLIKEGFTVHLISSIATARTRDAHYNSRDKNDQRDTPVILYLLKSGITQHYYDPIIQATNDIQELSNTHDRITYRKTQLQRSILNHYLPLYFPEAEKYFCSTRAKWFAEFFHMFPCPATITCYEEEVFIEKAWKLVGRKVDKRNWLKDVYFTAKNSVGLPVDAASKMMDMYRLILTETGVMQELYLKNLIAGQHQKSCTTYLNHWCKTLIWNGNLWMAALLKRTNIAQELQERGGQAIGKSRAGNTTKIHMATDACGLPLDFEITGGEVHDGKIAPELIAKLPTSDFTIADKGYDSEAVREAIREKSSTPMIPRKSNSKIGMKIWSGVYTNTGISSQIFLRDLSILEQ